MEWGCGQAKCLKILKKSSKSSRIFEILFSLKGLFGGQKASFKTILGPILFFISCYYSWLLWPDPKCWSLIWLYSIPSLTNENICSWLSFMLFQIQICNVVWIFSKNCSAFAQGRQEWFSIEILGINFFRRQFRSSKYYQIQRTFLWDKSKLILGSMTKYGFCCFWR